MDCQFSFTFEFETSQPLTLKGCASGGKPRTIAHRAFTEAAAAFPGVRWSSCVLVLERIAGEEVEGEDEVTETP